MSARRRAAAPSIEQIYNRHGDTRPSRSFLEKAFRSMGGSDSPDKLLAAAHVSIDLAFADPEGAENHLNRSREFFADIVSTTEAYAQYADTMTSRKHVTTAAILHAADIPNWQRAAQSEQPQADYLEKLEAADTALFYADNHPGAEDKVLEFIPELLGARGLDRGTLGWTGRLALNRENYRTWEDKTMNPNWDTGLCLSDTDHTIDDPLRVQIKRKPHRASDRSTLRYTRAGVAVVYADQTGFSDPFQIVDSCWNEIQPLSSVDPDVQLLSTEQLDLVTSQIHEQATLHLP